MLASMLQAGRSLMPVHFRWATEAEEQPVRSAGSKRAKAQSAAADTDDFDGLTAGLDGFFGKKQGRRGMHDNAKPTRGVLKKVMPMQQPGLELKTFGESCFTIGQPYLNKLHTYKCLCCVTHTSD